MISIPGHGCYLFHRFSNVPKTYDTRDHVARVYVFLIIHLREHGFMCYVIKLATVSQKIVGFRFLSRTCVLRFLFTIAYGQSFVRQYCPPPLFFPALRVVYYLLLIKKIILLLLLLLLLLRTEFRFGEISLSRLVRCVARELLP